MEFLECPQKFPQRVRTQSADWLQECIAEHFPWKTVSCEQRVCTFAPLAIYELRTYHEDIRARYSALLFWTLHTGGRDSQYHTCLSEGCAMRTNAECFIRAYTCRLTAANFSRVVWNLLGVWGKQRHLDGKYANSEAKLPHTLDFWEQ